MKLIKKANIIDFARHAFNSTSKVKESFVYETTVFDECIYPIKFSDDNAGVKHIINFYCECCKESYNINDLTIKDNTIHCKCGSSIKIENLKPYCKEDNFYSHGSALTLIHNVKNGTHNKFNVPTISQFVDYYFYCPECHKTNDLRLYEKNNGVLTCSCGKKYTFDECKLNLSTSISYVAGDIYFNDNKISISLIQQHADIKRKSCEYYWTTGKKRVTMNLDTGYTYVYNTGCCYTTFNREWKRDHDNKKAPKLFNATYSDMDWHQLYDLVFCKIKNLIVKYADYPNLVNFIIKKESKIKELYFNKIIKQIDDYMTEYLNKKYNYKINSLSEIFGQKKIIKDALQLFVFHNRFINANFYDLDRNIRIMIRNIKDANKKNVFSKMHRESNAPLIDLLSATTKISKSLRKRILTDYSENLLSWQDSIFAFAFISQYFKKKENVNKFYDLIHDKDHYSIYGVDSTMNLWLKFRTEEYITNLNITEFNLKHRHIKDSVMMINQIKDVFGNDWNENSIAFHNEKQYHDALIQIMRSEAFTNSRDVQRRLRLQEPFEMEKEVFELEDKNIAIALNEYELGLIGNEMSICVGGYGNSVREHDCRIAYIKNEKDEYSVCLELRKIKKNKKITYELRQAKLKYNEFVGANEKYYKIVFDWCEANDIKIITDDMRQRFNKNMEVLA